jgi:thiamine biosynthesis lipoprotein
MTASRDWTLWSTGCRLVVTDPSALADAAVLVDDELARVEDACSRFRDDSELMTLVRDEDGASHLSPVLSELVQVAIDAARETDGAVDPTIGSALVRLGYDRDIRLLHADSPSVTVVRRPAGWRTLKLEGLRLTMPVGTQLDLGATAKAAAADRCARLVHERLGIGVLVSLGGDIATAGSAPGGAWQVTVQDLPDDVPQQVTLSEGAAIATSSTAKRTWRQGGELRHHVVDPATGRSATGPWRSVTAVAPTCLRANVATTAALVHGEDALAWLRRTGLPARLVSHTGAVATLNGWPREELAA